MVSNDKPIIFFDLETTGVSTTTDRIVQIAAIKYNTDGTTEAKNILINPGVPIPEEASAVHGITDADVADAPTFKRVAKSVNKWFSGCNIGGFNSNIFDVPLLMAEFERAGVEFELDGELLDVLLLYRKLNENTLSAIYKRMFNEELDGAHNASVDIKATKRILDKLIKEHPELQIVESLDEFIQGDKKRADIAGKMYICPEGDVRWNFSKEVGTKVVDNYGFYSWFLKNDFSKESKEYAKKVWSSREIVTNNK